MDEIIQENLVSTIPLFFAFFYHSKYVIQNGYLQLRYNSYAQISTCANCSTKELNLWLRLRSVGYNATPMLD